MLCNIYNLEPNFRSYLEKLDISRTSINNYSADLRSYLSWLTATLKSQNLEFDISHVTPESVKRYIILLQNKNTPVKTINRQLSSLRTFLKWCIANNWIPPFPVESITNSKLTPFKMASFWFINQKRSIIIFFIGFFSVFILFLIPTLFILQSHKNLSNELSFDQVTSPSNLPTGKTSIASTSADLMTIPIIDQRGNLNLTAPYPKIVADTGTLSIEAPSIDLTASKQGSIKFNTTEGTIQFLFNGTTTPLPYESAFYFGSSELEQGTLIYAQTAKTASDLMLLKLSSGVPAETKFSVDSEGNVHVKGNLIIEGNIITNPNSVIFGTLAQDKATSSYSPEPQ